MNLPRFFFNAVDVTEHLHIAAFRVPPSAIKDLARPASYVVPGVMVHNGDPMISVRMDLPGLAGSDNVEFDLFHGAQLMMSQLVAGGYEFTLNGTVLTTIEHDLDQPLEVRQLSEVKLTVSKDLDMSIYVRKSEPVQLLDPNRTRDIPVVEQRAHWPETDAQGHKLIPVTVPHRIREITHSIAQQVQEAHMLGWYVGVGYLAIQPPEMRANFIQVDAQPHFQNYYSKTEIRPKGVCVNIKAGPFYE